MIDFAKIPAHEKDLIIKLPYRVGVWVSESDDVGGEEADVQEIQTLKALIVAYVEDFLKTEFVQLVMEQTVSHRNEWDSWAMNVETVPEECKQVVEFLDGKLSEKELVAFKNNILEIGYSVAMAYREFDDEAGLGEKFRVYLALMIDRLRAVITKEAVQSSVEALNISAAEQEALDKIKSSLFLDNVIEPEVIEPSSEASSNEQ